MVNITRSKPRKNTTWRSKQAASTAPHVLIRSRGAAIPAIQGRTCGIAHSSPNLTTISGRPALTRLDETAYGHDARVDAMRI